MKKRDGSASVRALVAELPEAQETVSELLRVGRPLPDALRNGLADVFDAISLGRRVERTSARVQELEKDRDSALDRLSRSKQLIERRVQTGNISKTEARRSIIELRRKTAVELEALIPLMRDLAGATGDVAIIERLEQLQRLASSMTSRPRYSFRWVEVRPGVWSMRARDNAAILEPQQCLRAGARLASARDGAAKRRRREPAIVDVRALEVPLPETQVTITELLMEGTADEVHEGIDAIITLLRVGRPLPDALRNWLADALAVIARDKDPLRVLGLRRRRQYGVRYMRGVTHVIADLERGSASRAEARHIIECLDLKKNKWKNRSDASETVRKRGVRYRQRRSEQRLNPSIKSADP